MTVFKDLLQGESLKSSLLILEKEYENAINTKGELDERMFANDEDSLLGSGSLSGGAINLPGTKVILTSKLIHPLLHNLKALKLFKIVCMSWYFRESMMLWPHLQNQYQAQIQCLLHVFVYLLKETASVTQRWLLSLQ